jgi:membrane protein YdbS with pleckstrin-like domain
MLHPHLESQEKIYFTVRPYWLAFVPRALIVLFLLLLPVVVGIVLNVFPSPTVPSGFGTPEQTGVTPAILPYLIVGAGIWYLLVLAFFHYTWIDFYMDMAIITDDRLIDISQHGIFHRAISEVSLLRVQDVNATTKGIFQTIFNFGRVDVETAGDIPNFVLDNRPKPFEIARVVQNAHERLVRQTAESGQRDGLGEIVSPPHPEAPKPETLPHPPEPRAPKINEKPQPPWPAPPSQPASTLGGRGEPVSAEAQATLGPASPAQPDGPVSDEASGPRYGLTPPPSDPAATRVEQDTPSSDTPASSDKEGTIPPVSPL